MIDHPFPGPDSTRSRLRAAVARVEQAIATLPPTADATAPATDRLTDGLRLAWADLVGMLALGPEPALRACPRCHQLGMRGASRCGHCWQSLDPLPALPSP